MIERKIDCFWRADARIVELCRFSDEEFKLLANSGLDWVFVGVENTVPRLSRLLTKGYPMEKVDNIITVFKKYDIILFMSLIVGIPTETIEELLINKKNINRWIEMSDTVYCQKAIFTPYPETKLTNIVIKHGFNVPKSLEEWSKHPLFVDTERSIFTDRNWLSELYLEKLPSILDEIAKGRNRNSSFKPVGAKPKNYL